jgi:hypothetical protein
LVQQTPALQWLHVAVADSYTQFCASVEHVASVVAFTHVFPTALHTGSGLHVQVAVPAFPVQLWCAPQATGVP